MRDPNPNPWPGDPRAYECPWGCNGTGTLPWFSHIADGVCFGCHGVGWIRGRGHTPLAQPRKRRHWRKEGARLVEVAR
jgi:hypothetical protein